MYKLIDSSSFFHEQEPTFSIIDVENTKSFLVKSAADSRISEFMDQIHVDPRKAYLHILAMGAGEYFGANRNGDYFPEQNLLSYYKTFETSPAHVFRNHVNKDPNIAIGKVLLALYNQRMHRVELVAEVDRELGSDVLAKIAQGSYPATSMACKTPYDVCSICGNKAHTRQEYCRHLREELGRMYPDGRKAMALNVGPLRFFDISIVFRPADVTSSVLQKLASEYQIVGSAEMAEIEKLAEREKTAEIAKLSEFLKQIDGQVTGAYDSINPILDKVFDPDQKLISTLRMFELEKVLKTFAEMGISPSLSFLAELVATEDMRGCGEIVATLIHKAGASQMILPKEDLDMSKQAEVGLSTLLYPSLEASSLLPDYVENRSVTIMPVGNMGYGGRGPTIPPEYYETLKQKNNASSAELDSLLKKLLHIGGLALLSKWYINRAIEEKMKQSQHNSGVKIVLVKSASDYKLTYKLAHASFIKELTQNKGR